MQSFAWRHDAPTTDHTDFGTTPGDHVSRTFTVKNLGGATPTTSGTTVPVVNGDRNPRQHRPGAQERYGPFAPAGTYAGTSRPTTTITKPRSTPHQRRGQRHEIEVRNSARSS
jgi:hypothetical protein